MILTENRILFITDLYNGSYKCALVGKLGSQPAWSIINIKADNLWHILASLKIYIHCNKILNLYLFSIKTNLIFTCVQKWVHKPLLTCFVFGFLQKNEAMDNTDKPFKK